MAEDRPLYEELLDYAVYAPAGVVLSIVEDLPGLVDKGRKQLSGQIGVANMLGKLAVGSLRRRVEHLVGQVSQNDVSSPQPAQARASGPLNRPETLVDSGITVGELAIPGYDSLAASQVVARLGGLSADELLLVRRYEQSTRARRTILLRIAQLEEDSGDGK